MRTIGLALVACLALSCTEKKPPPPRDPSWGQPGYRPPPPGYAPPGAQPQGYGQGQVYPQPGQPWPTRMPPPYPPGAGYPPGAYGPPPQQVAPPPQMPPPQQPPQMMPPPPAASIPELDKCNSETGKAADCKAALEKLAQSPQPPGKIYDTYKRACAKKTPLQGCGAFKSTAVTDADKPAMEALMACENGRWEACEDVQTKSPPLKAWHSTLKTEGCKKGEQALCKNYKECKIPAVWGCEEAAGAVAGTPKVCGCVPKCSNGMTVIATGKSWADSTPRGKFSCNAKP